MHGVTLVIGLLILVALVSGLVIILDRTHRRSDPAGFRPDAALSDADHRRIVADLRAAPAVTEATGSSGTGTEAESTIRVRGWLTT
jgi:hypothetical protein